MSITAKW